MACANCAAPPGRLSQQASFCTPASSFCPSKASCGPGPWVCFGRGARRFDGPPCTRRQKCGAASCPCWRIFRASRWPAVHGEALCSDMWRPRCPPVRKWALPRHSRGRSGSDHRTPRHKNRQRDQVQRGIQAGAWLLAVMEGPADRHRLGRRARDAQPHVGPGLEVMPPHELRGAMAAIGRRTATVAYRKVLHLSAARRPASRGEGGGGLRLATMGACRHGFVAAEQQLPLRNSSLAFSSVQSSRSEMYDSSIVESAGADCSFWVNAYPRDNGEPSASSQEWRALWSLCIENGFFRATTRSLIHGIY